MKLFKVTKNIFQLLTLLSILVANMAWSATNTAPAEVVKLDRIVAIVNDGVVTEQELVDRIATVTAQIEKDGKQLPPQNVLEKQILERLISDSLQLQLAAQTGIKVDDTQLDKTIERIADQNKMSVEAFKAELVKDGMTYRKFREDIRNEITLARLKEREVYNKIVVTDGEIDNYLSNQANNKGEQDEYEFSHILINTPENSTPEDLSAARDKILALQSDLANGKSFEQVSASYSNAPNAVEGGGMGWRNGGQIPGAFLEQLKSMQVGDVSKPIRSTNGFHILKLTNRRSASSQLVVDQTHTRHILIKLSEVVSEKEAKLKMDSIKERLDNGTKFEDMARQYSEDGSANNGGDLGWVNPGDTVPEFEKAMNDLKIGEISPPVRSPFGWHIIQVLERRKQDMTNEAARLKARQEIRARKGEEAVDDWLRELRDRAYVELRLEDKF